MESEAREWGHYKIRIQPDPPIPGVGSMWVVGLYFPNPGILYLTGRKEPFEITRVLDWGARVSMPDEVCRRCRGRKVIFLNEELGEERCHICNGTGNRP